MGVGLSGTDCSKLIKIPYIICYILNKEEILVALNPLSLLLIVFPKVYHEGVR